MATAAIHHEIQTRQSQQEENEEEKVVRIPSIAPKNNWLMVARKEKVKTTKTETIEEFLARGEVITVLPPHVHKDLYR